VFLILAIIAVIQVIRLVKTLNAIALKAQDLVDSAEKTADLVRNAVGQLSVMRFVQNVVSMVHKRTKGNKKGE
jgi:hypothetical protein